MTTSRVWTVGEGLAVLVAPGPGPAEHATHLEVGVGGAELNVAMALGRLGHPVTWIGVVGSDPWGRRIVRELRAEGVTVCSRTTDDAATGAYLRERRTRGLMMAIYMRQGSAGSQLSHHDVENLAIDSGDVLHLTGITPALSDSAHAAWVSAAQRAHERGALVSLDVNYRSALSTPDDARQFFASVRDSVDLIMASAEEADVVCGREGLTAEEATAALRDNVAPDTDIVIKDGANGSLHLAPDGSLTTAAAVPVDIEDLVGAGDAFAAGYLSGLLDGAPVHDRLSRGHLCAAFVIASRGDWEGAPRREELALAPHLQRLGVHR